MAIRRDLDNDWTENCPFDNPKLNVRDWKGNNPLRIVLDQNLSLPSHLSIFDNSTKTVVFNALKTIKVENTHYVGIDFTKNVITQVLDYLYNIEIQSVIIEGGSMLLNGFIESNSWDEARVFVGESTFKAGTRAPTLNFMDGQKYFVGKDSLFILRNGNLFNSLSY